MFLILAEYKPFIEKISKYTKDFKIFSDYTHVDSFIRNSNEEEFILVNPFITFTDTFVEMCQNELKNQTFFYKNNCLGFKKYMYNGGTISAKTLQAFIFSVKNRLNENKKIENIKTYSIILPFMYNGDRFSLFKNSLESIIKLIKNHNNWELCIHEIGKKQYLTKDFFCDYSGVNFRYKFTPYERIFHRAWVLNVGVKYLANNDYLILGDSDLIYTEEWFNSIQKIDYPCAGWEKCHFLSQKATEYYNLHKIIEHDYLKTNIPQKANDAGKITFIPKKIFYEIKGVPEHFKDTYGGEDNALAAKLEIFGYPFVGIEKATIYHLYHEHKTLCNTEITKQAHDMLWKWNKEKWLKENEKPWGQLYYNKNKKENIKILWCKHNRIGIINQHLLDALQEEMSKHFDITFIENSIPENMTLGDYNRNVFRNRNICKKTKLDAVFNKNDFDIIIADTPSLFAGENFKKYDCLKIGLIEDLQGSKEIYDFLKEQNFHVILNRYKNSINKVLPDLLTFPGKILWLPHSIDTEFFYPHKLEKKYDVVLLGSKYDTIYPLRNFAYNKLRSKNWFNCWERPMDHSQNTFPSGKDYVTILNQAKIGITCSSIYQYPIMKFMEFPACGSLLYADYFDELKELGYKLEFNMIEYDKKNLEKNLLFWIQNDKDREYIIKNGISLIQTKHSVEYRAKEFSNMLCNLLEIPEKFPEVQINNYVD